MSTVNEVTNNILDVLEANKNAWRVQLIVATSAGTRTGHHEAIVHAPDQLAAIAIAMLRKFQHVKPDRWDEVHILADPILPRQ